MTTSSTTTKKDTPICCVIGGTGYLAAELVSQLLSRGFCVNATVRNVCDSKKNAVLLVLQKTYKHRLRLFEASLDDPESFRDSFEGVSYIFHTAAPVPLSYKGGDGGLGQSAVDEIVRGAAGIVHVAASQTNPPPRIVMTSSASAVRPIGQRPEDIGIELFNESCWNRTSSVDLGDVHVYAYMKTASERAFWDAIHEYEGMEGVAIVSGFLTGPSTQMDRPSSLSIQWLQGWFSSSSSVTPPTTPQNFTDVRDCAYCHIEAALRESAKGQRYIVCNSTATGCHDIVSTIKKTFPESALCVDIKDIPEDGKMPTYWSNQKARTELGYAPRDWKESITEGMMELMELGCIPKNRSISSKKVAVVIGGCGGIGGATVEAFLEQGYEVHATGVFTKEVNAFQKSHPLVCCQALNICNREDVEAYASQFDSCDTLVNSAGINMRNGKEYDIVNFSKVLEVNLTGMMSTCTAFYPLLSQSSSGSIVNIASMNSFFGSASIPAYSASKGGVVSLTKSLAISYASSGVRVNAIAPGYIETQLTVAHTSDQAKYKNVAERTPLGRWGKPEDIADPIVYLASDRAAFVTGAILPVDGGLLVSGPIK